MENTLQQKNVQASQDHPGSNRETLAKLYDEHAAVVLGFLEKLTGDKDKAEELLRAVFLALPGRLHEFDPHKGRFTVWLLRLARTMAGQSEKSPDFKTNGTNAATKHPIRKEGANVHAGNTAATAVTNPSRPLTAGNDTSVVELLYVKGYTFAQAAAELGVDVRSVQLMVRTELKKYRN